MVNALEDYKADLERGEVLLDLLTAALNELVAAGSKGGTAEYRSYLHGQIFGLATALKVIYPGPGNLGERAAMAVRPVITEHSCLCGEEEIPIK